MYAEALYIYVRTHGEINVMQACRIKEVMTILLYTHSFLHNLYIFCTYCNRERYSRANMEYVRYAKAANSH